MSAAAVHDRHHRAAALIRGFITVAEAQAQGAVLAIPLLPLELALRELATDQPLDKEN
ncbi:hypothetical protein NM680_19985 [Paracoccus sp. PS-1]|jgi:hypothetical protein|uniref:hypothetical protein n=1 Tax=Paracoccus TaxID=265 RepID=UPI0027E40056|nr:hypothetical protein [Paracoccus sp. PS1]MDQ7264075.1 hypothetical protein [Paracoccus sp. PS1]